MERSYRIARQYLQEYPTLKGIIALGVPNVSGVANAIVDSGMSGKVAVVGNATPNLIRNHIKKGTIRKSILWNAPDHGYLTVYCAYGLLTGNIKPDTPFHVGRLGYFTPKADKQNLQVALPVMVFTNENIDQYHF